VILAGTLGGAAAGLPEVAGLAHAEGRVAEDAVVAVNALAIGKMVIQEGAPSIRFDFLASPRYTQEQNRSEPSNSTMLDSSLRAIPFAKQEIASSHTALLLRNLDCHCECEAISNSRLGDCFVGKNRLLLRKLEGCEPLLLMSIF
jgi:hypothetical protein